jgi:hypothetical protein
MKPRPSTPRIVRRERPPKMTGRHGCLKTREHLRRDFQYRCAYCMIHEQQGNGPDAFWIDHLKPRSKGGCVNAYANLYWSRFPCNHFKGNHWPTAAQRRQGQRFADPCQEQDYGVHFVENESGELAPQTPCGAYHVTALRLNRPRLTHPRLLRNAKQQHLAEVLALQQELERAVAMRSGAEAEDRQRLLTFMRREIESLQAKLSVAIPLIPQENEGD